MKVCSYLHAKKSELLKLRVIINRLPIVKVCFGIILGNIAALLGYDSLLLVLAVVLIGLLFRLKVAVILVTACISFVHSNNYIYSLDAVPQFGVTSTEFTIVRLLFSTSREQAYLAVSGLSSYQQLLLLPKYPPLNIGDRVGLSRDVEVQPVINKYPEGYGHYLRTAGVQSAIISTHPLLLENDKHLSLDRLISPLRALVDRSISRILVGDARGLALGLMIGDDSGMQKATQEEFSVIGIAHITAVSGLHVGLLGLFVKKLTSRLGRRPSLLVTAFILVTYLMIVGWSSLPTLRAVVMALVVILAGLLGRSTSVKIVVLEVVALFVLYNPLILLNLSLQLSLAAVLGILVLTSRISSYLYKLPGYLRNALAVSMSATLATMPFVFSSFGGVSLIGILANLIFLPVVPLIILLSAFATVLYSLVGNAMSYVYAPLVVVVQAFLDGVALVSKHLPFFTTEAEVALLFGLFISYIVIRGDYLDFQNRNLSVSMHKLG